MFAKNKILWSILPVSRSWMVFLALTLLASTALADQDPPPGITQPTLFPAFNPGAPLCSPPSDLKRSLVYVQENEREFLEGVNFGLTMAAKDRHLDYRRVIVENDVAKVVEQIQAVRSEKIGALVATSSDPRAVSSSLQEVIWSGAYVGTIVPT